jgi:Lrp/AsnC family leucine-responsive transcriptional regulator
MENSDVLDETDKAILRILQKNSHLTVKELAEKVHLSPSPTFERQKRLERLGYIDRYMAVVNPHKVGNNILVLCNIRLKQHTQQLIQEFMDAVQHIDEITECYNTSGDFDFLIKVYIKDMKSYQQFMLHKLGTIPCIGSLNSIFVIDHTKSTRGVPIPK